MHIHLNHAEAGGVGQVVTFSLIQDDRLHILHPQQIVAFRGASSNRQDKFMNISGMYRKKKLIKSEITGPCQFVAALPPGFTMKEVQLTENSDLLYDFRHLFFYSEGVTMQTKIQKIKNMLITRDAVKMKFSGKGTIGLLTQGQVCQQELHPTAPLYVDAGSVIAYPENAHLELTVYGNNLASQHMNYHWKMTGHGPVLFQAGRENYRLQQDVNDEGLFKRILKEVIPFGNVIIK
ncbi:AIM24 family protein [Paenibacillus polysaccharolyticus]|uniref:Biogenesis AIM24 n=2 Tax=Paenibacillus TaxID=44249 RepID=A0A1G5GHF0_9BACL|nr:MULTISPECIES: AIM24 family protein [Paenibacillus]MBY0202942.1 AIM24 family protein [Paenibacillus cucumis (ex Kampfer et al. 2016)]MCP1135561.1 AIM24 family protein [Paenibacillus polysaccharolyticus]SCY50749.1 biogenesis AIM24 [Paenibacillus polysaccharolyticus]